MEDDVIRTLRMGMEEAIKASEKAEREVREAYGNARYREGLKDGISRYSWRFLGVEYVGGGEGAIADGGPMTTLNEALARVDRETKGGK